MDKIQQAILRDGEEVVKSNALQTSRIKQIEQNIDKYYKKFNKTFSLSDYVFPRSRYQYRKGSYPVIRCGGLIDTKQPGYIGQGDEFFYNLVTMVINAVLSKSSELQVDDISNLFTNMMSSTIPITTSPPSSYMTREMLGLSKSGGSKFLSSIEKDLKPLIEELMNIPADDFVYKVSSDGNPGVPSITSDKNDTNEISVSAFTSPFPEKSFSIFKKAQIRHINRNFDAICDALEKFDMHMLIDQGVLCLATLQIRWASDKYDKERVRYFPYQFEKKEPGFHALDRVSDSLRISRDLPHLAKSYSINGQSFTPKAATQRAVFAESASLNSVLNLPLSRLRSNYGKMFPYAFKSADYVKMNEHIEQWCQLNRIEYTNLLDDYHIFIGDISQYDNTVSPDMILAFNSCFNNRPMLTRILNLLSGAPFAGSFGYQGSDARSYHRNKVIISGDPFNVDTYSFGALPSGIASVSEVGKLLVSLFVFFCLKEKNVEFDNFKRFLASGSYLSFYSNLGDNIFLLYHKSVDISYLINNQIFSVGRSDVFGGIKFSTNGKTIVAEPSVKSLLTKLFCPERPIDHINRSDYDFGIIDRYNMALSNKNYAIILDAIDKILVDHFGGLTLLECSREVLPSKLDNMANVNSFWQAISNYISMHGTKGLTSEINNSIRGRQANIGLSSELIKVLESGGDKLFYTDLYDNLSVIEQQLVDNLFYTVFDYDDIANILKEVD